MNFYKVKGHSDNIFNNICDELAVAERKKLENEEITNWHDICKFIIKY